MPKILVVSDEDWTRRGVHASLATAGHELFDEANPERVPARVRAVEADAVVADLQVGSMGGMAIARSVRAAAALGEIREVPVILLLDRRADAALARRSGATAWVNKPVNDFELRQAVATALEPKDGA